MPNLRDEITKTVLRLSRRGEIRRAKGDLDGGVSQPSSREGKQLGSYRILRRLGSGGMGHVYLALDTRLGRHVALKFLVHDMVGDYSLLYRLQQEARTASALNHPNIVTVYEIGELDGEPFIASEFIDGATLRMALKRGAIDVPTALDVAIQVGSALVAAHSAGVVHRDLKPGNIMVRPDGYVKVIDFGLAKQLKKHETGRSGHDFITQPGSVIGTVDYMSPEQARGDRVDHRTDIWSLGVVLYEMVANRRPFDGKTDSHVMVSILDAPLPPLPEATSVPRELSRILECALAKDPAKRYPNVSQMLGDLQQISPGSRSGSGVRLAAFGRQRTDTRARIIPIASAVFVLLVACLAWWWSRRTPDWFQIGSVRQLTFNGRTRLATISPDGNYLAFVVGEAGGEQALYLKQIDSATEEVRIPARRIDYVGLAFSPDSRYLFETEKDTSKIGKLYTLPILGGRPSVAIIEDIDGPVSFSPAGDQMAFVRYVLKSAKSKYETKSIIFIASRDGLRQRALLSSVDSTIYQCLAWSPGGERVAAILFSNLPGHSDESMLDLIDLSGRESRRTLPEWRLVGKPLWTPEGKTLILSAAARTQTHNQVQLREIAVDSGRTHEVTVGLAGFRSASLTRSGAQLSAIKLESRATVWVSAPHNLATGQTFLAEAEERPSLAWADGGHLILNSQRSGYPNLWLYDLGAQTGSSLTNERDLQQDAASTPDGKSIVFASNRTGQSKIWRLDRESGTHAQLTFGPDYDEGPTTSPDGKWILYTSWLGNIPHIQKIPFGGGQSEAIRNDPAQDAQISPDGKWIACYMLDPSTATWGVAVIPMDRSDAPRLVPAARLPFRWSPDGASLSSVLTDESGVSNVWSVPINGAGARQLTRFDDESISNLAWSPDGNRLACVRVRFGADVALFNRQSPP